MNISSKITGSLMAASLLASPVCGQDLADVFERVRTSVVTLEATVKPLDGGTGKARTKLRVGSGVLISKKGEILTAAHVVDLADSLKVEFADGTRVSARIVSLKRWPDLALVRTDSPPPESTSTATLGNSGTARVGNRVFLVGAPLGLRRTLTAGYISAIRRSESYLGSMRNIEHFQTDAAMQRGNSGGPMFDLNGHVIGTVCHLVSSSGASEGLGFAVTSNAARDLLLKRKGVWLGFDALPLSGEMSRALNVPGKQRGMLVQRVAESSPAGRLGLRGGTIRATLAGREILLGGDVILSMMGHSLSSPESIHAAAKALHTLEKGQPVRVKILRAGTVRELSAPIGGR